MYFSYNKKTKTAILLLKVKASAKTSCIHGFVDVNGSQLLRISIKAAPEDGKANVAIIKMLADIWGLRQNQLEIVRGTTSSAKMLAIMEVDRADVEGVVFKIHPGSSPG